MYRFGTMAAAFTVALRASLNTNPVIDTSIVMTESKESDAKKVMSIGDHWGYYGAKRANFLKWEIYGHAGRNSFFPMMGTLRILMLKAARYVNSFDKALIVHAIEEASFGAICTQAPYRHFQELGVPGIPSPLQKIWQLPAMPSLPPDRAHGNPCPHRSYCK